MNETGKVLPVRRLHRQDVVGDQALLESEVHPVDRAVALGEVLGEHRADQLRARPPDHLAQRLVDVGDSHVLVHGHEAVARGLEQPSVVGLLFGQQLLEAPLLGDVAGRCGDAADLSRLVREGGGVERHQLLVAVLGAQRELVVGQSALVQGVADPGRGALDVGEVILESAADELSSLKPGHLAHLLVHVGDGQHRIDHDETVERRLDQASVVSALAQELGLQHSLVGDVAGRGENAAHVARVVTEDRGVHGHLQPLSRPGEQREYIVLHRALVESFLDAGGGPLRLDEIGGKGRAEQVLARIAGQATHLLVQVGDQALRIDGDQAVDARLDEPAEVVLLLAQLFLQLLLLGDVARGREHALELAVAVEECRGVVADERLAACLGAGGELIVGDPAFAQHQADALVSSFRLREVAVETGPDQFFSRVLGQQDHLLVDIGDDAKRIGRHDGVDVRLDQGARVDLGDLERLGQANLVRHIPRDEEKADRLTHVAAARGDHDPGRKRGAVLPPADHGPFELAGLDGRRHHLLGEPGRHVLGRVQQGGVGLADDLLRLVSVEAARALVPELDVSLEVCADDRGLGGRLEHVSDEVGGGIGVGQQSGVDQPPHAARRGNQMPKVSVSVARAPLQIHASTSAVDLCRSLYRQVISVLLDDSSGRTQPEDREGSSRFIL